MGKIHFNNAFWTQYFPKLFQYIFNIKNITEDTLYSFFVFSKSCMFYTYSTVEVVLATFEGLSGTTLDSAGLEYGRWKEVGPWISIWKTATHQPGTPTCSYYMREK